jgi:hypothetical protein
VGIERGIGWLEIPILVRALTHPGRGASTWPGYSIAGISS